MTTSLLDEHVYIIKEKMYDVQHVQHFRKINMTYELEEINYKGYRTVLTEEELTDLRNHFRSYDIKRESFICGGENDPTVEEYYTITKK